MGRRPIRNVDAQFCMAWVNKDGKQHGNYDVNLGSGFGAYPKAPNSPM